MQKQKSNYSQSKMSLPLLLCLVCLVWFCFDSSFICAGAYAKFHKHFTDIRFSVIVSFHFVSPAKIHLQLLTHTRLASKQTWHSMIHIPWILRLFFSHFLIVISIFAVHVRVAHVLWKNVSDSYVSVCLVCVCVSIYHRNAIHIFREKAYYFTIQIATANEREENSKRLELMNEKLSELILSSIHSVCLSPPRLLFFAHLCHVLFL